MLSASEIREALRTIETDLAAGNFGQICRRESTYKTYVMDLIKKFYDGGEEPAIYEVTEQDIRHIFVERLQDKDMTYKSIAEGDYKDIIDHASEVVKNMDFGLFSNIISEAIEEKLEALGYLEPEPMPRD